MHTTTILSLTPIKKNYANFKVIIEYMKNLTFLKTIIVLLFFTAASSTKGETTLLTTKPFDTPLIATIIVDVTSGDNQPSRVIDPGQVLRITSNGNYRGTTIVNPGATYWKTPSTSITGSNVTIHGTTNNSAGNCLLADNTTSTDFITELQTKNLSGSPSGGTWSVVSGGGTISGSTYSAAATTVVNEGPATVTGTSLVSADNWYSLAETLSAGERLIIPTSFFQDMWDAMPAYSNVLCIGLKDGAWVNTIDGNNTGSVIPSQGLVYDLMIRMQKKSFGNGGEVRILSNYHTQGAAINWTYPNTPSSANVAGIIEITNNGHNVRMGITTDISVDVPATTLYSDWSTNKGQTGNQAFGITTKDVMFFWDKSTSGGQFDHADVDFTALTEVTMPAGAASYGSTTSFAKAFNVVGPNAYLYQTDPSTNQTPMKHAQNAAEVGLIPSAGDTSSSNNSYPWMMGGVYYLDPAHSAQMFSFAQAINTEQRILLGYETSGTATRNPLTFYWGTSNADGTPLNGIQFDMDMPDAGWYSYYIDQNGVRLNETSVAEAAAMLRFKQVDLLTGAVSTLTGTWTQHGTGRTSYPATSQTRIRMGKPSGGTSAKGDQAFKIANFAVSTLRADHTLPTDAEIELFINDPNKWRIDYRVGTQQRFPHHSNSNPLYAYDSYQGYMSQHWSFGDHQLSTSIGAIHETFPALENGFRAVGPNVGKASITNGTASDIVNVIIPGLTSSTTTWTGASNTDWATAGNWDNGVPSSIDNVTIPVVDNAPIISGSTNASVNDLTITESDGLTVNSGGSLIVSGTSTGNITYNRNLATINWYLVSSPVVGETYDDAYVTANSIALGASNNRGIAPYTTNNDSWDYMQSGETVTFTAGNGYSVKRSTIGDVSFTGTLNVADAGVDVALSNAGNRFNLLGNPYTSHIASATFLTNEAAVSETQTLWVWNQATGASGAYVVKTIADALVIAPAQGFFVKANAAGGTFNFAESNQASTGGTFQRTENRPEIYLTISNQTDARDAKIYYIENMTTGFDVGYEGELFNGVSNPFAIYTHLVTDSEGKNYQVQSLPINNYENMIIPVGINALSGTAISIDAATNNFPEGVNIYLEDKQDNSFTLLEADANFSTTLENDLSGIGRFYLHTTSGSLSTGDLGINKNISIYKSSSNNLRIVGVQNGAANVQMYNILGKEALKTSFEGNGVNNIKLTNLSAGVYILKLTTENGIINKKLIIQ